MRPAAHVWCLAALAAIYARARIRRRALVVDMERGQVSAPMSQRTSRQPLFVGASQRFGSEVGAPIPSHRLSRLFVNSHTHLMRPGTMAGSIAANRAPSGCDGGFLLGDAKILLALIRQNDSDFTRFTRSDTLVPGDLGERRTVTAKSKPRKLVSSGLQPPAAKTRSRRRRSLCVVRLSLNLYLAGAVIVGLLVLYAVQQPTDH